MINKLYVKNWKCFAEKTFDFERENIINKPNGWGKTSMFQAIIFGLYGKMPSGFNLNTLRLDPLKTATVSLEFTIQEGDSFANYRVKREFGNKSTVILEKESEIVANSSREAFEYINDIYPYEIVSVLWAPNTLSNSTILRPDFLINSLLSYVFADPRKIEAHYKRELYAKNRSIKTLESRVTEEDIEEKIKNLDERISSIRSSIKERSNISGSIAAAKQAEESANQLKELPDFEEYDLAEARNFLSILGRMTKDEKIAEIKNKLEIEKSKSTSIIHNFNKSFINQLMSESENLGVCIMCNGEWNEAHANAMRRDLSTGSINHDLITKLEKDLSVIEKYEVNEANLTIEKNRLLQQINKVPNYKEILDNHSEENNRMWNELESLENQRINYIKMGEAYNTLLKEKEEAIELRNKMEVAQGYIADASSYYSRTMTEIASKILSKLNPRYEQIFLDEEIYKVSVMDNEMKSINLLPAMQLSSGEKTLIGISLILAAHKLFLPGLPLLFDESFSALDIENILSLKELFQNMNIQIFIITHDSIWLEN